ncbi:proteophosphoglycan ppg4 [Gigaspora margarita]|uniref:Proteophosphoglycan ppg4 n=1 Tax=Gigaspora margarita TaxID=4874 RepID=A0A8H3WVT8_GIGMA|nr:proteophosphoglycan ppg4 [Gigaspora margarita]
MMKQLVKDYEVELRDGFYITNIITETKEKFVNYFKNKERTIPLDQKNNLIYSGSTEVVYQEIIRLYNYEGLHIFYSKNKPSIHNDSFRPLELNQQQSSSNGSPAKLSAKLRKPSHILYSVPDNVSNRISLSEQKRKMMNIRKAKREYKGKQKENIPKKSKISVETSETISQQLPADISQQVVTFNN